MMTLPRRLLLLLVALALCLAATTAKKITSVVDLPQPAAADQAYISATAGDMLVTILEHATIGPVYVFQCANGHCLDVKPVLLPEVFDTFQVCQGAANTNEVLFLNDAGRVLVGKFDYNYGSPSATWKNYTMPTPRSDVTCATVGSKVLLIGGLTPDQESSDKVDVYDGSVEPGIAQWEELQLSQARHPITASAAGGKVFMAGGTSGLVTVHSTVDVFDEETGELSVIQMNQARTSVTVVGWEDLVTERAYVVLAGGLYEPEGGPPLVPSEQVDVWDVFAEEWLTTYQLPTARWGIAGGAVGASVILAAGYAEAEGNDATDDFDVITFPSAGGHQIRNMHLNGPRRDFAFGRLEDGVFVVAGGTANEEVAYSNMEVFYEPSQTFTEVNMDQQRSWFQQEEVLYTSGGLNNDDLIFFPGGSTSRGEPGIMSMLLVEGVAAELRSLSTGVELGKQLVDGVSASVQQVGAKVASVNATAQSQAAEITANAGRIDALQTQADGLPTEAYVNTRIATATGPLNDEVTALKNQLAALQTQLTTLHDSINKKCLLQHQQYAGIAVASVHAPISTCPVEQSSKDGSGLTSKELTMVIAGIIGGIVLLVVVCFVGYKRCSRSRSARSRQDGIGLDRYRGSLLINSSRSDVRSGFSPAGSELL